MVGRQLRFGRYLPATPNLNACVATLQQENIFSYGVLPLFHPGFDRGQTPNIADRPLCRSSFALTSQEWNLFLGATSLHIDVDSPDAGVRQRSEKLLKQELDYASHVFMRAVLIRLTSGNCVNLAAIVSSWLSKNTHCAVWVLVPALNPALAMAACRSDVAPEYFHESPWEWWCRFRTLCDHHPHIAVVLDVGPDLPPESDRNRWLGELVRAIFINTSTFVTNKKNYPVLSQAHQKFITQFAEIDTEIILGGPNRHNGLINYVYYLHHIWRLKDEESGDFDDNYGFSDHLQSPLQPLKHNLDASTYEVFEKDPVKYKVYGEAVESALLDRVSDEDKDHVVTVIMVMGAGRGPLVQMSLDAAERANRKVRLYAVEKNPNAVITLQCRRDEEWHTRVTVLAGDMRTIEIPEKADILVSELLGSFGDNELSPECLDGAQKFLKDDGISIPQEYTSYLCPIMSHKLFSETRACPVKPGQPPLSLLETSYVVLQKNKLFLAEPQPLFTFKHPNKDAKINNNRYEIKTFKVGRSCTVHGFSGFFHTTLYKDHVLSIVPDTFSHGMFSWYPLYIPIQRPVYVPAGGEITVHFWRRVGDKQVWYEWTISKPEHLPIHNIAGRSSKIGL